MSERIHSRINIATELAERAIRWAFEHTPTSHFGKSDRVVNVAERTHQIVVGSWPPESEVEVYEPQLPLIHHTVDNFVMNRDENDLGWDSEGTYYIGHSGQKHPTVRD